MSDTENNLFVLPIEFLNYKQKIFKNLDEDLELLSTHEQDSENVPVYNKIFNPQTECGNNMLERLGKHYTTDTTFLSDTQKLYSSISDIKQNSDTVNSSYKCWNELKNTDNFCEKYYYLEWDRLKWLNKSPAFMSFLSFYNISSPVLNLLAPLTLLVVPFFMLKLMKVKVTFENYKEALFAALKNHAIGKLFYSFNQVQLSQKIYFSAMIGLYFYNIYQNIVVCYRFYKNLQHISNNFKQFKNYFDDTINKIDYICSKCESLSSYNMFCKHLQDYKLRIIERLKQLEIISNKDENKKISLLGGTETPGPRFFRFMYYESILQDAVKAEVIFQGQGSSVHSVQVPACETINSAWLVGLRKPTPEWCNRSLLGGNRFVG